MIHTNPPANCNRSVAKNENATPRHNPRVNTGAVVSKISTTTTVLASARAYACAVGRFHSRLAER